MQRIVAQQLGRVRHFSLAAVCACLCLHSVFAQDANKTEPAPGGVSLVSLSPPSYSSLARTARIDGEVKVELVIKKDGSIESARVVSGPPMLALSALDSANKSKFECGRCQEPTTFYTLIYTYQISLNKPDPDPCLRPSNAPSHGFEVTQSANHVIVVAEKPYMCPNVLTKKESEEADKYRSIKCFYLWKCGNHHYGVI